MKINQMMKLKNINDHLYLLNYVTGLNDFCACKNKFLGHDHVTFVSQQGNCKQKEHHLQLCSLKHRLLLLFCVPIVVY